MDIAQKIIAKAQLYSVTHPKPANVAYLGLDEVMALEEILGENLTLFSSKRLDYNGKNYFGGLEIIEVEYISHLHVTRLEK